MHVVHLEINGFRGVRQLRVRLDRQAVVIGPNGCGKTTIADALALALGRDRPVRTLTEHDFYGCDPQATDRIRIVATIGGSGSNDANRSDHWFREGRAIERWWDPAAGRVVPEQTEGNHELCAQIAFAARFDRESLAGD